MSTRAQLSETLNRLLPGEQWKRVREGILHGANYSGNRTDLLRKSIDEENRIKTGRLVEGIITITTPTTADISEWVWVIDYEIFQPDPVTALAILAPDAIYPRPDYFVGTAAGIIEYRPSTIDSFGNSFPPTVDSDEVVLRIIQRNPDESNTDVEPETVAPDFTDVLFHTAGTSNTIGKYAKIMEMNLGFAMDYSFTLDYGASATLAANKVGSLHVAFVCTEASVIHSPTVKLTTVGFSEPGDFVLVQLPDNKAALYHYSTNVEMRLQWRVLFKNWLMAIGNFQSGNEYEALPAGDNWQSEVNLAGVIAEAGAGIGITLNGKVIGGVKRLIELTDVLTVPIYWEYNAAVLDVEGSIILDGEINIL